MTYAHETGAVAVPTGLRGSGLAAAAMGAAIVLCGGCGVVLGLPDPTLDDSIGKTGATTTGGGGAGGHGGSDGGGGATGGGGSAPSSPVQLHNARVRRLLLDQTSIYWTEEFNNKIGRMDKDGANKVFLASGLDAAGFHPSSLAIDDTDVYWSGYSTEIRKCSKTGCGNNPTVILSEADGYAPAGIEVDADFVYFGNYIDATHVSFQKMPKAGGPVTELVPSNLLCPSYNRIRLVDGFLYYTCENGVVGRAATLDGAVEVLSPPSPPEADAFVVANGTIYYSEWGEQGRLFFLSTAGYQAGNGTIALDQPYVNSITADALYLYWVNVGPALDNGSGKLMRCAVGDCNATAEQLVGNQDLPQGTATDETSIYWSNLGNGDTANAGIWKLSK